MRYYTTVICLLFFIPILAQKSKTLNDAIELLEKAEEQFEKRKFDSVYVYGKRALKEFQISGVDSLIFKAAILTTKGKQTLNIEDTTSYINIAKAIAVKHNNWKYILDTHYCDAVILEMNREHAKALPLFLKVDSISRAHNYITHSTVKAIRKRAEISRVSHTKEGLQISYKLLLRALDDAKKINLQDEIHYIYIKLGNVSGALGKMEDAKKYIDLGLNYFVKTDLVIFTTRAFDISIVYYSAIEDFKKAEEQHQKKIKYIKSHNDNLAKAKALGYYGYFKKNRLGKCKEALELFDQAKLIYDTFKEEERETEEYHRLVRDLAICNLRLKNYENASKYYDEAYRLNLDLTKKRNEKLSREIEAKYETERKEEEIANLKEENKLSENNKILLRNLLFIILGIVIFLFIINRNRQKVNVRLKELETIKSNFYTNITHEFRTPLTLISVPIQEKLENPALTKKERGDFEMMQRNNQRLLGLVDQLLEISKAESGMQKLQIQKDNVLGFIKILANSFVYRAEQRNIEFIIDIDKTTKEAWFDKDIIETTATNLLSNAIKYTPERGKIICKASIQNSKLYLEVKNTGQGLSQEQTKKVFERFYQVDQHQSGSGIGLSLVKELVKLHEGKIEVSSKPDEWTAFKVELTVDKSNFKTPDIVIDHKIDDDLVTPLSSRDNVLNEKKLNNAEDSELPIILIVEDNEDLRTMLSKTFTDEFKVFTAENGEKGIQLAQKHIPDLIISDVMMPIKGGIELTKELKNDERTSHIPIILLTAKVGEEHELIGIQTGADDYITKPFNHKILVSKVNNRIKLRQKLQERYVQEPESISNSNSINTVDKKFWNRINDVLQKRLKDHTFSIEEFSVAIGMSRNHLYRKLMALTGMSPSKFIAIKRLKLAEKLLKRSDLNISEIAYDIGFNNVSYFNKFFKEIYGCTPSEYTEKLN